jgi:hypothetical protein
VKYYKGTRIIVRILKPSRSGSKLKRTAMHNQKLQRRSGRSVGGDVQYRYYADPRIDKVKL